MDMLPGRMPLYKPNIPWFFMMYWNLSRVVFPTPFVSAWFIESNTSKGQMIQKAVIAQVPPIMNFPQAVVRKSVCRLNESICRK